MIRTPGAPVKAAGPPKVAPKPPVPLQTKVDDLVEKLTGVKAPPKVGEATTRPVSAGPPRVAPRTKAVAQVNAAAYLKQQGETNEEAQLREPDAQVRRSEAIDITDGNFDFAGEGSAVWGSVSVGHDMKITRKFQVVTLNVSMTIPVRSANPLTDYPKVMAAALGPLGAFCAANLSDLNDSLEEVIKAVGR